MAVASRLEAIAQSAPKRTVHRTKPSAPGQHPLEGYYVVFLFSADYTEDTEGLAICKVTNGKLEEAWHPSDHTNPLLSEIGEGITDEQAIRYLAERNVKTVYTLTGNLETYLGMTLLYADRDVSFSYESLSGFGVFSEWQSSFREHGIHLRVFNNYANTAPNDTRNAGKPPQRNI